MRSNYAWERPIIIKQDHLTERPPKTGDLLTVLRRLDAVLENSKEELLDMKKRLDDAANASG
jgi:hypothetical protein